MPQRNMNDQTKKRNQIKLGEQLKEHFFSSNIERTLYLLVTLAILPALMILLYGGVAQRDEAIAEADKELENLAANIANMQMERTTQAKLFLQTLAIMPEVRRLDGSECTEIFRKLLHENTDISNVALVDLNGVVLASALPTTGKVDMSDRLVFQEMKNSMSFSPGDYVISKVAGVPAFPFGVPVIGSDGNAAGFLMFTTTLKGLEEKFNAISAPRDSRGLLLDRNGVRLMTLRWEASASPATKALTPSIWRNVVDSGNDKGRFSGTRYDGVDCLYRFIKLRLRSDLPPYMVVLTNTPLATVLAGANRKFATNMSLVGLAGILAMFVAHFFGRGIVGRQIKSLMRSEEKFRTVADHTYDWEYWRAPDGRYLWVSPSGKTICGHHPEYFLRNEGAEFCGIVHPNDKHIWESHINEVDNFQPEHRELEFRIVKPTGEILWISHVCKPIFSDEGELLGRRGCNRDITDRLQAQNALGETADRYRMLFTEAPVGIIRFDQTGSNIEANPKFSEIMGAPAEIFIGFNNFEKIKDPRMIEAIKDAMAGNLGIYEGEYTSVTSGKKTFLRALFKSTSAPDGSLTGGFGIFEDISERRQAQKALLASEDRFRRLTEESPMSIMAFDSDGRINFVSKWHLTEFCQGKLTAEFFLGRYVFELPGIVSAGITEEIRGILDGKAVEIKEVHIPSSAIEAEFFQYIRGVPLVRGGQVVGGVMIRLDVTERKKAEEALRESEERYRNIFNNSVEGIYQTTPEGRYRTVNPAFAKMFGYDSPEEMTAAITDISKQLYVHQEDREKIIESMLESEELVMDLEVQLIRKDGFHFWASINGRLIQDAKDKGSYIEGTCMDITERKRTERELWQKEHDLRSILDSIPSLVGSWDKNLHNRFCNKTYLEWFGIDPAGIPGMHVKDVIGEEIYLLNLPFMEGALRGIPQTFERTVPVPDGNSPRHSIVQYIPDIKDGEVQGLYAMISDITLLKQAQRDIERARDAAESANLAKSEFLANMSHEIRTPLNGIMGMLQLLETASPDEEQKEYLAAAKKSSGRLTHLLSDLLDLSRIEAGKLTLTESAFNVEDLKGALNDLLSLTAREKGLSLEFSFDERIPPTLIGDENRLLQILFNLVGNAIKFSNTSPIRLETVPLTNSVPNQVRVLFAVSDKGIGISDEQIKDILEPFVQGDKTHTKRFQGAGLGLSIVRKLVKMLDGELTIDSTVGEGTTVYLSLPFTMPAHRQKQAEPFVSSPGFITQSSLRILLAEDDDVSLQTAKKMLEKFSYLVTTVENGQQVLSLLTGQDFDLILMDVQMPILDGVEATKNIRASGKSYANIPIIAMTAYAMAGDKEKFLATGMNDYIAKPVDMNELEAVIRRVMGRRAKKLIS